MYCTTLLWCLEIYVYISLSLISSSKRGYSYVRSDRRHRISPDIHCTNLSWNPHKSRLIRGVATIFPTRKVSMYLAPDPTPTPSPPSSPYISLPGNTRPSYTHHCVGACGPLILYLSNHKSRMGKLAMYCTTLLWCLEIYVYISLSLISSSKRGYSYVRSDRRHRISPDIHCTNLSWNPHKSRLIRGVATIFPTRKVVWPGQPQHKNAPTCEYHCPSVPRSDPDNISYSWTPGHWI